jgi:mannose/cellobiose epimerase-like protein (N-acyl-D-glucosamine 2-epimerase family)
VNARPSRCLANVVGHLSILFLLSLTPITSATDLPSHARALKRQLTQQILPYWYDTAQDRERGGYLLADDGQGKRKAVEKQLVTQARMIWTFSHVHHKGYRDASRDYLKAARQGYEFLLKHFLDQEHGGYFWKLDPDGKVLNERKIVYGQAFVIYALVEYHRASGDAEPLRRAIALYALLQKHAHDEQRRGWLEHFQRDWQPILKPQAGAEVEVPGYKSANTHLHLMEAFSELYEVTHDAKVKDSLRESLDLNRQFFYPQRAAESCFHRQLDWKPVTDPKSGGLSYGHNVEFAWLMIRAQQVLGTRPTWRHFDAHLQHALRFGYDRERGGLYNRGVGDKPATDTDKVWWVQAEMLAALTDGMLHQKNAELESALDKLLHFLASYQADSADGVWYDTMRADGTPKNTAKAHSWKANYHDVRAIVKFIEAFGTSQSGADSR